MRIRRNHKAEALAIKRINRSFRRKTWRVKANKRRLKPKPPLKNIGLSDE